MPVERRPQCRAICTESLMMSNKLATVWQTTTMPPLRQFADGEKLFALIDAAQIDGFTRRLNSVPGVVGQEAVWGMPLAPDRQDATLHLLELASPANIVSLTDRLAQITDSHGAMSLMVSSHSLSALAQSLRLRLDVVLPDQFECLNRYYDGRITPHFVDCLSTSQRRAFCAMASQWWVVGHDLQWLEIECHPEQHDPYSDVLHLDVMQQAHMIDASYPYAVIEHFKLTDSEILDRIPRADQYAFIHDALSAAEKFGINGGPDAILLCTLALVEGAEFYDEPSWRAGLERVQQRVITLRDLVKARLSDDSIK